MSLPILTVPAAFANVDLTKGIKEVDLVNLDLASVDALLEHAESRLAILDEEGLTLTHYKKGRNTIARNGVKDAIAALSARRRLLSKEPGNGLSTSAPASDGVSIKRSAVDDGTQPEPSSKRPRGETVEDQNGSPNSAMEVDILPQIDTGRTLTAHPSSEMTATTTTLDVAANPSASSTIQVDLPAPASSTIQVDPPAPASSNIQVDPPAPASIQVDPPAPASIQVDPPAPASSTIQVDPPAPVPSTIQVDPPVLASSTTHAAPAPVPTTAQAALPTVTTSTSLTSTSSNAAPAAPNPKKKAVKRVKKARAVADGDNGEVEIVEAPAGTSTAEEYQDVYDVDEGRTVREPKKKYDHMANNWNSLKEKQKERITDTGIHDAEAYDKSNTPFSDGTRTWCLRHHAFLSNAAVISKKVAAHIFINGHGRTRCVIHAHNDGLTDDTSVSEDAPFQVTGTPFPPQPVTHGLTPMATLGRTPIAPSEKGKERAQARVLARNPNFTLSNVLKFFPLAPDGKTRILHCGCALDGALLDFYLYKTLTIKSLSTDQEEPYGRRFSTRERLAIVTIVSEFGLSVDDLFTRDSQGKEIGKVERLKRMIERLEVKVDKVAEEEYKTLRRRLVKQVKDAKQKFRSRWVDVPDRSASGAGEDDLSTQALLSADFSDSSDEDDDSYHTGSDPDSVAEEYEDGWDGESAGIFGPNSVMGDSGSEYDDDAEGESVGEEEEEED